MLLCTRRTAAAVGRRLSIHETFTSPWNSLSSTSSILPGLSRSICLDELGGASYLKCSLSRKRLTFTPDGIISSLRLRCSWPDSIRAWISAKVRILCSATVDSCSYFGCAPQLFVTSCCLVLDRATRCSPSLVTRCTVQ